MTQPPMLAADHIRELTRPYTTTETIQQPTQGADGNWRPTTRLHTVHHPPLLTQLRAAAGDSSSRSDNDAAAGTAKSKPTAHLEALDVLARIDRQARAYATELDVTPRTRHLESVLHAIAGHLGTSRDKKVRSWWAAARLVTHWDSPPLRPHGAPCPTCWETDSLRVHLVDELATCTACGDTWDRTGHPDHGSLDMLGQHVRWCTDHEVTKPRHWTLDPVGELIECVECLPFRDAYTEWRMRNTQVGTASARAQ